MVPALYELGYEVIGAYGQDDGVSSGVLEEVGVYVAVEVHRHVQALELVLIPEVEPGYAGFEGVAAGLVEMAAHHRPCLIDLHVVAAQLGRARALHASHAHAYDDNLLGVSGTVEFVAELLGGVRIHAALDGADGEEACDAVLAGDAGPDTLGRAHFQLLGKGRVGQGAAREGHAVSCAGGHGLLGHVGVIHLARYKYGYVHRRLDRAGELEVVAIGLVIGRAGVVEAVVCTAVAVEHVVAVALQLPGDGHGVLDGAADLFFTEERGLVEVLHPPFEAHAYADGVVLAALALDALDYLLAYQQPSVQVAAVLVRAVVGEWLGKLVEQIAPVHGVDLHPVKAAALDELGALYFLGYFFLYLLAGERGEDALGVVEVRQRRGRLLGAHAAVAGGELDKHLGAVGVDAVEGGGGRLLEVLGRVERRHRVLVRVLDIDRHVAGDGAECNEAEAAASPLTQVVGHIKAVLSLVKVHHETLSGR